ncbi:protein kinase domain-containing protein [Phthorimaea operculella]|nr:protein kinase domain-containing protein [Phthorimaea operculella]
MEPGSPSLLWPLRVSKPAGEVGAGGSKAEERAQSPSLVERLSAGPASPPAPPSPQPQHHQFQAALVAEKYLLLEQVEGSSLCRCVDVRTQEEYVCKVVSRDCSSLLQAHYRLDGHPHVNPIHEVLVGDKRVYLIFPRSHSDLHSYVRARKRLREHEARRLFRQMAETVAACHEQGIVLRDLKLRKFVFADPQRTTLKLESLEDAVVLDDPEEDLLQDKRGCPAYVSPEILRAHRTYSGRAADMWSLGVILYTMLVGRYPFNDSEHASLFAKISRGYFVVPECLSSRGKCLIRSLLRREASERLSAADVPRPPRRRLLVEQTLLHTPGNFPPARASGAVFVGSAPRCDFRYL